MFGSPSHTASETLETPPTIAGRSRARSISTGSAAEAAPVPPAPDPAPPVEMPHEVLARVAQ